MRREEHENSSRRGWDDVFVREVAMTGLEEAGGEVTEAASGG